MLLNIHETVGYGSGRGQHRGSQAQPVYSDSTGGEDEQVEEEEKARHRTTRQDDGLNRGTGLRVRAWLDSPAVGS
ncbi:hypothetical protein G6F56_014503 [Rhizopus delemar]|nr:hypothetical protein G6F56_014503 [Rhizopus delemar]